jgi:hypothetical protein
MSVVAIGHRLHHHVECPPPSVAHIAFGRSRQISKLFLTFEVSIMSLQVPHRGKSGSAQSTKAVVLVGIPR